MSKTSKMDGFLDFIERGGNKLPNPVTLFFYLFAGTLVLSAILSLLGVSAEFTTIQKGEVILKNVTVFNMLSGEGIKLIFTTGIANFTNHPALGAIIVAMMGVGVAEGAGLMSAYIKKIVIGTPKSLISVIVVFTGVLSNIASDAGYIVLVPLGGLIFASFGRHPLAGIAAAFAGVSGGFSANLLLGTADPLLAGISTIAAQIMISDYYVSPTSNYYFMVGSTFLITILGAIITDKVVEPRLGKYTGPSLDVSKDTSLTADEKKGLLYANVTLFLFVAAILAMVLPENGALRLSATEVEAFQLANDRMPTTIEALRPFFSNSIIFVLMLFFLIPGLAYGIGAKTITSDKTVIKFLNKSMVSLAPILIIFFISGQFIYVFNQSNIGIILAVNLANLLQSLGVSSIVAVVGLIFISAFINLFMGSASSKWLILSPIFIPLFMRLGISPELTQVAYRIGDSSTNIITPLMTYFPVILTFVAKYKAEGDEVGLGSVMSLMFPYSIVFLVAWSLFFLVWILLGIPIGPGVESFITIPSM